MKILAFLIICIAFVGVSGQNPPSADVNPKVSDLGWMAGCWAQGGKSNASFISENWTKPYGVMIGTNRTVRDGKVRAFEYLRIESRENDVFYVAKPSGASGETSFKLITLETNKVVFENKGHDFPKRVIYSRTDKDKLAARVEDDSNGIEFVFEKVDCDG